MTLPEISIRRPVLAAMMSLALVLFGIIGLSRLPVRELPDVDPPVVNVLTVYPGANAEVVETEVTELLEDAINSAEQIKSLTSTSREEVSNISVEFELSRDIDLAAQDVRDRVSRVRGQLPDDIDEPVISKQDGDARPFMWVALFSEDYSPLDLTQFAENNLIDQLESVPGVSSVIIGGEKRFAVRVQLESEKMAARGVTVADVENALREQNLELPSGRVENLQRELTIQTLGELQNIGEFNRLVILEEEDDIVRLEDIGTASVGVEDLRAQARYRGKPAVGLGIIKLSDANTISVADGIKSEIDRLEPVIPDTVSYFIAYDESTYVEKAINEVWITLGIAFVLVIVTIFVFLRNVRSTLVPGVTIPVAIAASFGILFIMGFSVNIITMLALVLVIGVVVDDSIVVLENIFRHIEEGEKPLQAAINGMREITFAVIATTISLVAVFVPMALQRTLTGRIFTEFALALAGAVVISSFVALTLTPSMCARVLREQREVRHGRLFLFFENVLDWVTVRYERTLRWVLRHPVFMLAAYLVVIAASVFVFTRLDREFLPTEDRGRLFMPIIAPEGSTSEYTDRMVRQLEEILAEQEEIAGYFTAVALPRNGPGQANQGIAFVRFKEQREKSVQDVVDGPDGIQARAAMEVEGAIAPAIIPSAIQTGFGQPFQLILRASNLEELDQYAQDFINHMRQEGVLNPQRLRSSFNIEKPELQVSIDRDRAAALGVTVENISSAMQILFGGQDITEVTREGKQYEVIVQLGREARLQPKDLDRLYVRNDEGSLVQLSNVVNYETTAGPNAIERYNRIRSTTIEGQTLPGVTLGTAMTRAEEVLDETMPPNFRYAWEGDAQNLRETGADIYFVIIVALIVVYMALASQFESLLHPFTILIVAVPMAFSGAVFLLWFLDWVNAWGEALYAAANYAPPGEVPAFVSWLSSFVPRIPAMNINIFSQIGFVLLIALVTKNAILLVEFANQMNDKRGLDPLNAMVEAGKIRLRPILMTAFSTIAGILPIAIGFGAGAESRRPLGVVAVGGMTASTLFTLVMVPVAYVAFEKMAEKIRGRRSVQRGVEDEETAGGTGGTEPARG